MIKPSVKNICEFIWKEEQTYDLLNIKSRGVNFWPLIRFSVYHDLTQKSGVFGKPHPKSNVSSFNWSDIKKTFISLSLRNPFFTWGRKKVVIMPHARQVNGKDIYCDHLIENTPKDDLLILYKHSRGRVYPNSKSLDFAAALFLSLLKLFKVFSLDQRFFDKSSVTYKLEQDIQREFDVDVPVTMLAIRHLLYFKVQYFFYYHLFKMKKPEVVYLTTSYTYFATIAAAQACDIKVIEMQHGTITKYHLGYSYPVSGTKVSYTPDEIHCFGQFWVDATPFAESIVPVVTGFDYMKRLLANLKECNKVENQVLIPSQGPVAKDLFPFSVKLAQKIPEKTFIYRLHPSEELKDFQDYLLSIDAPENFRLSSADISGEPTTYELMAESVYQLGVSSTTLFEGMCLGCKVGVLGMPSSEYMESVVEKGYAFYAQTVDDVVANIDDFEPKIDPSYYYA